MDLYKCFSCNVTYDSRFHKCPGGNISIESKFVEIPFPTVAEGVKHDLGKPDHTMISNDLLDALAAVRAFGAKKYDRDNWRQGFKFNRSLAACYRHINAFKEGEDLDKESGLCHIGHAVACLEHLLGDYLHRPHNDDRYKPSLNTKVAGNNKE